MLDSLWALQYCPTITFKTKLSILLNEVAFRAYIENDQQQLSSVLKINKTNAAQLLNKLTDCKMQLDFNRWHQLLSEEQIHYVDYYSPYYPKILKVIDDPPVGLWVKGNLNCLNAQSIAVIGSRKATPYGIRQCNQFCRAFINEGCAIISGLAYGIDTQAHRTATEMHAPTIAILGSGIERLYPAKNQHLAHDIINHNGAIVSEYHPNEAPLQWHFPERNRIISGMAIGVVIIEATLKSGSLITANHAAQQGREVFALPASADCDSSRGCHQLIKDGANLADCAEDVLAMLGISRLDCSKKSESTNPLMNILHTGPLHIDKIVHLSGLTAGEVSSMLTQLELDGSIARYENGLYYLK